MKTRIMIFMICLLFTNSLAQDHPKLNDLRSINANEQMESYKKFLKLTIGKQASKYKSNFSKVGIYISDNYKSNSIIYFFDNFEGSSSQWTTLAYEGTDMWHKTTTDATSGQTSYWCGIEDNGNYNTGERILNALISPTIDLNSAVAPVHLLFAEKYETEQGWDFCMVDISTDGGSSWNHLRGGYGSAPNGSSDGWQLSLLDLSPYVGNNVLIRFLFDTGDNLFNEFPGWLVDDILIYDQGGLISGKKFFDFNQNGIKDIEDKGIKDWYINANGNGISITAKTNIRGRYQIPLPLGNYLITEENRTGWTQTCPIAGQYSIELISPDSLIDSLHFGNYTQAAFLSGVKFNDLNQNSQKDPEDTLITGWKIWLYQYSQDEGWNLIDYDKTDSLGTYNFFVLSAGEYQLEEISKYGWTQTYPPEGIYSVTINNLDTILSNLDFGNYGTTLQNYVSGYKFFDENRNGVRDSNEVGLANFKIKLMKKAGNQFVNFRQVLTDSNGYYSFLNLPPNVYKVTEVPVIGWWQSLPDSFYIVDMASEVEFDTLDFGNYQIGFGSISGMIFHDINGNNIKDDQDSGLSNWYVILEGNSHYNTFVNLSTLTNSQGEFTFENLLPGNYTVNQIAKSSWRQTYPTALQPHFVQLGPEEVRSDIYFGNIYDTTFNLAFRTFNSDSFALAYKPVKKKPDKIFWQTNWIKPSDFSIMDSVRSVTISFKRPPILGSISVTKICSVSIDLNQLTIFFNQYLQPNDSIKISGLSMKLKPQATKWIIFRYDDSVSTKRFVNLIDFYEARYPMPNAVNVLEAGAGNNLRVGIGGPHTVLHRTYKDVMKSLIDKYGRMHIGDARCLDKFTNRVSIKRQQNSLTPTKGNNKLFAEAVALKANIKASDFGIIPQGFGNLIFDEGGDNPMNGMSIRGIATTLDLYMSSYDDFSISPQCLMPPVWSGLDPETLYTKIRMINDAFCGPIDTISFASRLQLKPVKLLSEVPFLRLDSSYNFVSYPIHDEESVEIPDKFVLLQNYPNPFNPNTLIEFYLPEEAIVTVELYNVLGQRVATILNKQEFDGGWNEVEISADQLKLASGIYYYKFSVSLHSSDENKHKEFTEIKRMVYIK